ncbi:hypothetical protein [Parablautia intestinalis]|jgi:hypothetical protein|uniref:hypothetical protein n=1 Tax=Parablautia intestinalis TaxID=2320100 RepID=UPI0023D4BE7C|nr:hypothetical protein [Parablautia intestinalis]MCI8613586.1 hypothetical protein [Lachnospiraceae bacterium]MDE7047762.1 hypothetical protein [Lachnospiraceae bacterium]
MVKELNQEKLRKKKEKEKQKDKKRRWKRINARVDRTIYLFAVGICVTACLLEVKCKKEMKIF